MSKEWKVCDSSTLLNYYINSEKINNFENKLFEEYHKAIEELDKVLIEFCRGQINE